MEGVREESIQTMIQDNLEEQIPRERIIIKLQKRFERNAKVVLRN